MALQENGLFTTAARLATFQGEHHQAKRRASNQKKKTQNTVSWPHEAPTPEDLSRAGFYYKPTSDSDDNCACFLCEVKLDGWESGDIPLDEHLSHSKSCPWAISLSCARENENRDPMDSELLEARRDTYADLWPHEKKKAWKPKIAKMVDAGWCFDPSDEAEDGVTCFYCNLSLDGWEPKDNPMDEHRRRSPTCSFFALLEHYGSTRTNTKAKRGRASSASKTSRLSTQSMQSTFSEAPSSMSLGDAALHTDVDESLGIDSTITSDAGTAKGRKKSTKAKSTSKPRKKAVKESLDHPEPETATHDAYVEPDLEPEDEPEPVHQATKPTRGRKPKRVDDSQTEDPSGMETDPPAKTKKTRAKPNKVAQTPIRVSEDVSQLQAELQEAASYASAMEDAPKPKKGVKRTSEGLEKVYDIDTTLDEAPVKPKKTTRVPKLNKGKKATKQVQENSELISTSLDESTDMAQQKPKAKRGRKPKKTLEEESEPEPLAPEMAEALETGDYEEDRVTDLKTEPELLAEDMEPEPALEPDIEVPEIEEEELQDEDVQDEDVQDEDVQDEDIQDEDIQDEEYQGPEMQNDENQDDQYLDENEEPPEEGFEEEPDTMATPATLHSLAPTPAEAEFEPTPTPQKPRQSTHRHAPSSTSRPTPRAALEAAIDSTPSSPQSSNAENRPPSSSSLRPVSSSSAQQPSSTVKKPATASHDLPIPPGTAKKAQANITAPREIFRSPAKTTRVPLAPGTPNRSPSRLQRSPSKLLGQLTSSTPWTAVDLETVFFLSPEKEKGDGKEINERLAEAGGALTKEERAMTVEEWIRWKADMGDKELRAECERLVGLFEKEGARAQEVLMGIETVS